MGLLEDLQRQVLIGDGAMGTLLYSMALTGVLRSSIFQSRRKFSAYIKRTLKREPTLFKRIRTGPTILNYPDTVLRMTSKMNQEAVKIARASAGDAYVLGTMGGIRTFNKNAYSLDEIKRSFREQLYLLLHEEPDGLLLETYYDLEEAREVLKIARKETDLPIMLNVSMHEQGVLQDGTPLSDALRSIADLGLILSALTAASALIT